MTEGVIIDWLLNVLPAEAGPICAFLASHFDQVRPLLLIVFICLFQIEVIAAVAFWRWLTSNA